MYRIIVEKQPSQKDLNTFTLSLSGSTQGITVDQVSELANAERKATIIRRNMSRDAGVVGSFMKRSTGVFGDVLFVST